jgi:hypothetical protein
MTGAMLSLNFNNYGWDRLKKERAPKEKSFLIYFAMPHQILSPHRIMWAPRTHDKIIVSRRQTESEQRQISRSDMQVLRWRILHVLIASIPVVVLGWYEWVASSNRIEESSSQEGAFGSTQETSPT